MWPSADSPSPREAHKAAVIDVGSNSVRLVIYRIDGRALWTVYNEKVVAGLGRDLPATGRLSSDGVKAAMIALRRFRAVLEGWPNEALIAAATAAVREAADGQAFLDRVRDKIGLNVRVLTGQEEAHFAALGVIAGQPNAQGIVGDLGGSSLELVRLNGECVPDGATLSLGPFALGAPQVLDVGRTGQAVDDALVPLDARFACKDFHAVGGAWRNLALLHMQVADYPLHVAHQYEISRADILDLTRFVERQSRASLERIEGLSKKRFDTLPYAALVLDRLIERLGAERVIISAYGVREGLLLEAMPAEVRNLDPLVEGCEALTTRHGLSAGLGAALESWVSPAFSQLDPVFPGREKVLVSAACRLADLGARLHPDHRADLAFDQILRAPIAGMNHAERAFLACVAFSRHSSALSPPDTSVITRLLTPERRQRARALGAAVRLGCDVSGRNAHLLEKSSIMIEGENLILRATPDCKDMLLGDQTSRRAQTLALALKLRLELA